MKYYSFCLALVGVILAGCNAGSTTPAITTANNIPYLIEAKLTESSLQNLITTVDTVKYSNDYLLNPEGGHSTIAFAPNQLQYEKLESYLTTNMSIVVSEYCWSNQFGVEAAKGTVYNSNNTEIVGTDPFQHITISYANVRLAVDSNYLFECSDENYSNYSYCTEHNLQITDLVCTKLTAPITLAATLFESEQS